MCEFMFYIRKEENQYVTNLLELTDNSDLIICIDKDEFKLLKNNYQYEFYSKNKEELTEFILDIYNNDDCEYNIFTIAHKEGEKEFWLRSLDDDIKIFDKFKFILTKLECSKQDVL